MAYGSDTTRHIFTPRRGCQILLDRGMTIKRSSTRRSRSRSLIPPLAFKLPDGCRLGATYRRTVPSRGQNGEIAPSHRQNRRIS